MEHLKIELQQRVKQIDDAIAKHEGINLILLHFSILIRESMCGEEVFN